jgi:hypothetical protein
MTVSALFQPTPTNTCHTEYLPYCDSQILPNKKASSKTSSKASTKEQRTHITRNKVPTATVRSCPKKKLVVKLVVKLIVKLVVNNNEHMSLRTMSVHRLTVLLLNVLRAS